MERVATEMDSMKNKQQELSMIVMMVGDDE
jgi:hypothetical protein